jgi:hypothetical protein
MKQRSITLISKYKWIGLALEFVLVYRTSPSQGNAISIFDLLEIELCLNIILRPKKTTA